MHVKHTIASFCLLTSFKCTKESRDHICLGLLRGKPQAKVDREEENQVVRSSPRMWLSECNPHSIYTRENTVWLFTNPAITHLQKLAFPLKKKVKPAAKICFFFLEYFCQSRILHKKSVQHKGIGTKQNHKKYSMICLQVLLFH